MGTTATDWAAWENRLAALFPDAPSPDRGRLLGELDAYARAIVREARRRGADEPSPGEVHQALSWLDAPVFVCGHHRTGTTLLAQLLDGHPELLVLPSEGTYLDSFPYAARSRPPAREVDRFAGEWIARFVDPNEGPHFLLRGGGAGDEASILFARRLLGWHERLRRAQPERAPFALLLALVAAYRDVATPAAAPRFWLEKTPRNERHAMRFSVFPGARFVQLVRHPAATMESLLELYRQAGAESVDVAADARRIGRSLWLARANSRALGERYRVARYEDLVADPAREMNRIAAFLGVSPSPSLAITTVLGRPVRSNSSFARGEPGVVHGSRSNRSLSHRDRMLVSAFAAGSAAALGYEVEPVATRDRAALLLDRTARYGTSLAHGGLARAFDLSRAGYAALAARLRGRGDTHR